MVEARTRKLGALAVALATALAGCHSYTPAELLDKPSPGGTLNKAEHNKLIDHPSAAVSVPSAIGLGLGTIVGVPVMIVALPITLPLGIAAFSDDPKVSNADILANAVAWPNAVCAVGGCYAVGGIPYMIVGPSSSEKSPSAGAYRPVRSETPRPATPMPPVPPGIGGGEDSLLPPDAPPPPARAPE